VRWCWWWPASISPICCSRAAPPGAGDRDRQALGSGRARIVRQLLVEGLTLAALGAVAGLVIGWWSTRALAAWLSSALPLGIDLTVEPSWRLAMAAVALAMLSTALFALGPAIALSRPNVSPDLKETRDARAAGPLRRWWSCNSPSRSPLSRREDSSFEPRSERRPPIPGFPWTAS
jgi:hypothetical protein